jgi:fused signal recognition particle receptor
MGFRDKLRAFFTAKGPLNDEVFEDLLDLLIEGDFDASLAMKTIDALREKCRAELGAGADVQAARGLLEGLLLDALAAAPSVLPEIPAADGDCTLLLLLGVNGVGKTTTAAKLASRYAADNPATKPILAACDTFRAAAIEQLKIHGERLSKKYGTEIRVVAHTHGSDPGAVLFDAAQAATASGSKLIIADTAGRMHTKSALVEELKKIDRVAAKAGIKHNLRYLVLDATTGSNASAQADVFSAAVKLDGVILTKYDSTAKGGIVFTLAGKFKLPVIWLCTGEGYTDIAPFDAGRFVK